MKNALTYKVVCGCIITLLCYSLPAQNSKALGSKSLRDHETDKRVDHYLELTKLGYADSEIFEDLGNANFLTENYATAVFWYAKLKDVSKNGTLSESYDQRYQYALSKTGGAVASNIPEDKDWLAQVKADYQIKNNPSENNQVQSLANTYKPLGFLQKNAPSKENPALARNSFKPLKGGEPDTQSNYEAPITITADGKTAYFSKAVYIKPLYGVFSKKELVHKIFKADKIDGKWQNIKEVAVCPKYYSSMQPSVSPDGKRLFFASNMPGTFGKYDIYVSAVHSDGTLGVAKNLGEKVNTKKNDLYPNIVGNNTLVFASDGRKGYGGLDVYMAQVDQKKVGLAVNLGSSINSMEDDFSISLKTEKGMRYVMTNRGKDKGSVQWVAFTYPDKNKNRLDDKRDINLLKAINNNLKIDYTSSVFEDE